MLAANMSAGHRNTPSPLTELSSYYNEKFLLNLTQVLNISADNLTSLLQGLDTQDLLATEQQQQQTQQPAQSPLPPPMALLATLTVCYALIFVAGVLGNLITCIVISRNNFMHTATNFYLFNLAISDMILLCSGGYTLRMRNARCVYAMLHCVYVARVQRDCLLSLSRFRHATGSVQSLAARQLSLLRRHLHPGERALRDRSQCDRADHHVVHRGALHRHLSSLQVSVGAGVGVAAGQLIDVSV